MWNNPIIESIKNGLKYGWYDSVTEPETIQEDIDFILLHKQGLPLGWVYTTIIKLTKIKEKLEETINKNKEK